MLVARVDDANNIMPLKRGRILAQSIVQRSTLLSPSNVSQAGGFLSPISGTAGAPKLALPEPRRRALGVK